jgi:hypothetical protein
LTRYFRRIRPSPKDNLGAGLVAAGLAATVAAVAFYFVRLFLAREPLTDPEGPEAPLEEDPGRESAP